LIYAGDQTPAELKNAMPDEPRHDGFVCVTESDKPASHGGKKSKPAPVCVVSGEALDTERMLRFVIGPENTLYPDFAENLPGKVLWCNLYGPTLRQALATKAFGADVVIPDTILDTIEKGLRFQALSMVSMARKAGHLYTGAEKTEQMIRNGKAAIYLTASPKDADTRMKLTLLSGQAVKIVDLFDSDELSRASGMNKVFHAALMRGALTKRFFANVRRMNLFRQQ
jgi:ribosomal protein L7Ae-like RNA K-turn-binding protein